MKKKPPFFLTRKFMAGFIVIIMVLSLGAVFSSDLEQENQNKKINGRWFYPTNQGWFTYLNDKKVEFQYLPDEVSNISTAPFINIRTSKVYIIHDPNIKNLNIESSRRKLAFTLYNLNILSVFACGQEQNCLDSLPIKNCKDINVQGIFLKKGSQTRIYEDHMCYIIEADSSANLLRASEKFIYQLLGFIK